MPALEHQYCSLRECDYRYTMVKIVLVQFGYIYNCTCWKLVPLYGTFFQTLKRQNPSQLPATGFVCSIQVLAVDPVGQSQRR